MTSRIMTVDLEPDLRSDRCISMASAVPKLLDFFDEHRIKATFFTVTSLLEKYETQIKEIAKKHEIASHSHSHAWLTKANAEQEIKVSKEKLKGFKIPCQGFRAPGFIVPSDHFPLLKKHGYSYDASLARFFPGRYANFRLPQRPFYHQGLLEFPLPTFVPPLINAGLPYLKLFHPLSKLFPQRYMLYLHPWEFLEKKDLHSGSFLKTLLRRNSGEKAWGILRYFLEKEESDWVSCKGWMEKNKKVT